MSLCSRVFGSCNDYLCLSRPISFLTQTENLRVSYSEVRYMLAIWPAGLVTGSLYFFYHIFTGPRCLWGPVYGSRCQSLPRYTFLKFCRCEIHFNHWMTHKTSEQPCLFIMCCHGWDVRRILWIKICAKTTIEGLNLVLVLQLFPPLLFNWIKWQVCGM